MNPLKSNFRRNNKMEVEYCVKQCGQEMDSEHLVWCKHMNEESEFKYMKILNGDLEAKINTYKQIQRNELISKEYRRNVKIIVTM